MAAGLAAGLDRPDAPPEKNEEEEGEEEEEEEEVEVVVEEVALEAEEPAEPAAEEVGVGAVAPRTKVATLRTFRGAWAWTALFETTSLASRVASSEMYLK